MVARIEFLKGINEVNIPRISLTRSRDGSTGTAIFKFYKTETLNELTFTNNQINNLRLIYQETSIKTNHIRVVFVNGKPKLIYAVFIFKAKESWTQFIQFMEAYSKQKGLIFKSYKV